MAMRFSDLESLVGVWTRRSIRWPDGREDKTTRVWWVQGCPHFADIRIPAGRPSFDGVGSLANCDNAQREWLSRQEGFAGILERAEGAWLWNRQIDYPLKKDRRDIGRLEFTDEHKRTMIEEGVDESYTEVWERIDDASSTNGRAFVARLKGASEKGLLVAVGGHFILAVDGSDTTGIEVSHGIRSGPIAEWRIAQSTLPCREGKRLFGDAQPVVQWNKRELIESRTWEIIEPSTGELEWIA